MDEENIKCPQCGSKDVDRHWGDKLIKGGAEIVGGFLEGYLFGGSGETGGKIAGGLADEISQKYECNHCGHTFTKGEANKKSSNSKSSSNKKNSNLGNSNNRSTFNSSKQNALYKELRSLASDKGGFNQVDYSLIINLGKSYGLSKEQIYEVAMKCMWKNGVKPSMTGLFGNNSNSYTIKNNANNTSHFNSQTSSSLSFNTQSQNALYQELYTLSSDKGGFSQADFDIVVKMGNSYNLTQDEIFQVAQKCLWKSWITLTKEQLFNSNVEQSITASSTSNKEIVKKNEVSDNEKEYIEELKSIYSEQSEITDRERRLLNRLSKSLGISDERAKELEDQVNPNALSDKEQEYAEEIKACLEDDGVISDRERRILNRLATSLDITPERAWEIEKFIISKK